MADFTPALEHVLRHEGGWVSDPADPGGETNFGISTLFIRSAKLTAEDLGLPNLEPGALKGLTREKAAELYRRFWWDAYGYEQLVEQDMANKLLDTCVNIGRRCHLWAQDACNQLGARIAVDGLLGPSSYEALNAVPTLPWLKLFSDAQATYYRAECARYPSLRKFLVSNWLKRASWLGN